jgi:hypothetical protein
MRFSPLVVPDRFLKIVFWLSVVVAAGAGAVDAYNRYKDAHEERQRNAERRLAYECAAKARDDDLLKARNEYGNINVRGAPFFCAERDLWVGMSEIEPMRKGTLDFPAATTPWFRWHSTAIATAIGFVATYLIGFTIAGMWMIIRWAVSPFSRRN